MRRLLIALVLVVAASVSPFSVCGQEPQVPAYLVLQAPAKVHKGQAYYPGRGYAAKPQAYAYGWFGAQPRNQWRRQTGHGARLHSVEAILIDRDRFATSPVRRRCAGAVDLVEGCANCL